MFGAIFSIILFLGFLIHVIRSLISFHDAHSKLDTLDNSYKKKRKKLVLKYFKQGFKAMIVVTILFLIYVYINLNYLT